jgi:hypothetical protein
MGKASSALFTYPNFFGTIQSFVDRFLAIPAYISLYGDRDVTIDDDVYESRFLKLVIKISAEDKEFWKNGYIYNLLTPDDKELVFKKQFLPKYLVMLGFHPIWVWDKSVKIVFKNAKKNRSLGNNRSESYRFIEKLVLGTIETGTLRFADAYSLANYYISRYPQIREAISRRFSHLFIDEMQDTDSKQNDLIQKIFDDSVVVKQRIGDPNQAIFESRVSDERAWEIADSPIRISSSKRISAQIAKVIRNLCILPEESLEGENRGTDEKLAPVLILYDDQSQCHVISKFCELVGERKYLWREEMDKTGVEPVYYAVGWIHEHNGTTSKGEQKTSIKSYFPEYKRPIKTNNPIHDSLKSYLIKPIDSTPQKVVQEVYNSLMSCFLRVLHEGGKLDGSTGQRYTKSSLLAYLRNDEEFYSDFRSKLASWIKLISKHPAGEEIAYPNVVFEQIRQFLSESWFPYFGINQSKLYRFINGDIEQAYSVSPVSNVLSSNGIDAQVGTIHSVKGQTHTATLFLECFSHDFNGNQLLHYLTGDKTYLPKDGKNKKNALKVAYVATSRPTHFLCAAFHKERIPSTAHNSLRELGWDIQEI